MIISLFVSFLSCFLLIIQGWWFWYWSSYGNLHDTHFKILEISTFLCFVLVITGVKISSLSLTFFPSLFPGILYSFIKLYEKYVEKEITEREEKKEMQNLLYTVEKQPDNVNAYVHLGDIYFKREDYDTAVDYYKRAYQINQLPWIKFRIDVAEREKMIKKEKIWICPECGRKNTSEVVKCMNCGFAIKTKDAMADDLKKVWQDKNFVKKNVLYLALGPFAIIGVCILFFFSIYLMVYFFKKINFFVSILLTVIIMFIDYLIFVNLWRFFFKEEENE